MRKYGEVTYASLFCWQIPAWALDFQRNAEEQESLAIIRSDICMCIQLWLQAYPLVHIAEPTYR